MPLWFLLAVRASVMLVVFAIGLQTTWANATFLFRQPVLLIKSMIARNVAMPLIAILLAKAFPVHPAVKIAILVLSVTPVPPLLPNMLVKAGGSFSYACGLLVSHSVFAIVVLPLTVELMNLAFGTHAHFGPLGVARVVVITILLPLAAGMVSVPFLRASAFRVGRLIGAAGTLLLLLAMLPLLVLTSQLLPVLIGNGALLALALFFIAGLSVGHLFGGPTRGDRSALALATASRHPGLAIAVAVANAPRQGKLVVGAVIIYLVLAALLFLPYNRWRRKASDRSLDAGTVTAHT